MSGPLVPRKINRTLRRKLEAAAALASERLIERHAVYALELIEAARGKVPPLRAIEIYVRLHHLRDKDAERLTTRVLAAIGQTFETKLRRAGTDSEGGPQELVWDTPESWATRLRNRLRGRVYKELRRWIEVHTGRVEVALFDLHVENALRFHAILGPDAAPAAVVGLYVETVGVRRSLTEMIYLLLLDRLSRMGEELEGAAQAPPDQESPLAPAGPKHPLRIVTPST